MSAVPPRDAATGVAASVLHAMRAALAQARGSTSPAFCASAETLPPSPRHAAAPLVRPDAAAAPSDAASPRDTLMQEEPSTVWTRASIDVPQDSLASVGSPVVATAPVATAPRHPPGEEVAAHSPTSCAPKDSLDTSGATSPIPVETTLIASPSDNVEPATPSPIREDDPSSRLAAPRHESVQPGEDAGAMTPPPPPQHQAASPVTSLRSVSVRRRESVPAALFSPPEAESPPPRQRGATDDNESPAVEAPASAPSPPAPSPSQPTPSLPPSSEAFARTESPAPGTTRTPSPSPSPPQSPRSAHRAAAQRIVVAELQARNRVKVDSNVAFLRLMAQLQQGAEQLGCAAVSHGATGASLGRPMVG